MRSMHPGDAFARIRPEHIKRYGQLLAGLNKLMREIREYEPKASIYVEDRDFNLTVQPGAIVVSGTVHFSGTGIERIGR